MSSASEARAEAATATPAQDSELIGYETLQFHRGGLFDGEPTEEVIHLVRCTRRGTPGPTLCQIGRFAADASALAEHVRVYFGASGWSVGGGISGPKYKFEACDPCVQAADVSLPVKGTFASLFVAAPA